MNQSNDILSCLNSFKGGRRLPKRCRYRIQQKATHLPSDCLFHRHISRPISTDSMEVILRKRWATEKAIKYCLLPAQITGEVTPTFACRPDTVRKAYLSPSTFLRAPTVQTRTKLRPATMEPELYCAPFYVITITMPLCARSVPLANSHRNITCRSEISKFNMQFPLQNWNCIQVRCNHNGRDCPRNLTFPFIRVVQSCTTDTPECD